MPLSELALERSELCHITEPSRPAAIGHHADKGTEDAVTALLRGAKQAPTIRRARRVPCAAAADGALQPTGGRRGAAVKQASAWPLPARPGRPSQTDRRAAPPPCSPVRCSWARPPITYLHIHEDAVMSLGVFVMPALSQIPLHDHPGMTVFTR